MTNPFLVRKVFVNPKEQDGDADNNLGKMDTWKNKVFPVQAKSQILPCRRQENPKNKTHEMRHSVLSSSKGQMFVVAAVFMLVALVFLFNLLGTHLITEEKQFQETRTLGKNAQNVMKEYKLAAGIATLAENPAGSAAGYFGNMSEYYRSEFDSRMIYYYAFSNGSTQKYSVLVGNYANENINFTINVTGSNSTGGVLSVPDKSVSTLQFSAGNATVNITITYTDGNDAVTEMIQLNVSMKNAASSLFDVMLRENDFFIRNKDVYWRVWA